MNEINWDQYELVNEADVAKDTNQSVDETATDDGIDWSQFEPVEEKPKTKKREPHPDPRSEFLIKRGEEHQQEGKSILEASKGFVSGVTAGVSRLIPGMKPEGGEGFAGEVAGSIFPIGWLIKGASIPLRALASKSPILQNQMKAFANLTGVATAGAVHGALDQATESGEIEIPSVNDVLNHGAAWAAIDAGINLLGWSGRFGKALWNKVSTSGSPVNKVLAEVAEKVGTGDKAAEKAISILEGKPLEKVEREVKLAQKTAEPTKSEQVAQKTLQERTQERAVDLRDRKVSQKDFTKLEESMGPQSKPYLPAEFEADKIAEEAISQDLSNRIENISQRATSERELGQNIKADLERGFKATTKETDALYDIAKKVEGTTSANLESTANAIVKQLKNLQRHGLKTKPAGYAQAEKQLIGVLEDLGYAITQDEAGMISDAILNKPVSLAQSVEVKKRLNKIINYDLLETGAQDFLKDPAAKLRQDIRNGYGPKNSVSRDAFEKAESRFGEIAEKKGKKTITNMRYTESPESIAKIIKTPSGLADVKDVVSKEQFAQIERELLEHMKGMNEDRAAKYYREVRDSMSPDVRTVAEEIIASKAPATSPTRRVAQRNKVQEMFLDDIAKASVTGQRADNALKLWKTKEGQQLIKHALEENPNKKEIIKYLSEQSLHDLQASVVSPNGEINFKKFNEFLKDPATAENVRLVAGEEGLNFLKQLETLSQRAQKNKSILEGRIDKGSAKEREKINQELDRLGKQRLEDIKSKNTKPTKAESAYQETFGKEPTANRKETQKSLETKGKERFKRSREKRENLTKDEKLAAEALEKSGLIYKLDDLLSSYGIKGKLFLTALGMSQYGFIPGAGAAASAQIILMLAKNKSVQHALKKAAGPRTDPKHFLQAFEAMMKAQDED